MYNVSGNNLGIFINDVTHMMNDDNKEKDQMVFKVKGLNGKKWEPQKSIQTRNVGSRKESVAKNKLKRNVVKQVDDLDLQGHKSKGILDKPLIYYPIDMISML